MVRICLSLILILLVLPAFATKVQISNGSEQISLDRKNNVIRLKFADEVHTFRLKPCNRPVLEKFWDDIVHAVKSLPRFAGRETQKPHVKIDSNEIYLLEHEPAQLRNVRDDVSLLQIQEARACGTH